MNKPEFVKATGGNCGLYAIAMGVNALLPGVNIDKLVNLALKSQASYFGELFTRKQVIRYLKEISKEYPVDFYTDIVYTQEDFEKVLRKCLDDSRYCLLTYNTMQGIILKPRKPSMKLAHWMCVYDLREEEGRLDAIQSNSKGEYFNVLTNVRVSDVYKSNEGANEIHVNFGKYFKCPICKPSKLLEVESRCTERYCTKNVCMESSKCVYKSDLTGVIFSIKKRGED